MAIRLDTGETIAVEGGGLLIGRSPAAAPGEHGMGLYALPDDAKSVSKTHIALVRSGNALIAVDRASTNGSSLIRGGIERALAPGEGVETADGDTIRFGDRSAEVHDRPRRLRRSEPQMRLKLTLQRPDAARTDIVVTSDTTATVQDVARRIVESDPARRLRRIAA